MIKNGYIALSVSCVIAVQGCGDTTIIAVEHPETTPTGDTDTDRDTNSDTPTSSDAPRDTDSNTAIETDIGTDTNTNTATVVEMDTGTGSDTGCGVPTSFSWISSDPLISPPGGASALKDPTALFHDDQWHIFATTISGDDYSMAYLSFTDWDQADAADKTPVSRNENLTGYKAAPQLFYFSPHNLWYLVYQTQEPAYSTNSDPSDLASWTPMTRFMTTAGNIDGDDTKGFDYWVICDDTDCYMFFSALNDVLYRARTAKADFPDGFEGRTIDIVMEDDNYDLFDACNVYKMAGTDQYLLLVSAIGSIERYFRAWTADRLDGDWTPLADTESNAFISINNVTRADWALSGFEHGEMLRENPDETMTIDTCDMRYIFSGVTRKANEGDDSSHDEYRLGLLTDTR